MLGYIYQIKNDITGQSYIGQTVNIFRRQREHFNELDNNKHCNSKLQNSWNKYGRDNFSFTFWSFTLDSPEELDALECEYIERFDSLKNGFNLAPGGGKPPIKQIVKNEDIVTYLCVLHVLGDGYGKTCEQVFGWAKGTASRAKRRIAFREALSEFDKMTPQEKTDRGEEFIESQQLRNVAFARQLKQGGCEKAYSLTQDDFNFAFCAQELGYGYAEVAKFLGIKEATTHDWFGGRSRNKEREIYLALPQILKDKIVKQVKEAKLELYKKTKLISKNEDDIIDYFCCKEKYQVSDMKVQNFYGWSEGSCYGLKKPHAAASAKYKFSQLTEEEKSQRADSLYEKLSR